MSEVDPFQFLILLANLAIVALPLVHLRERHPKASYLIAAGGGLRVLGVIWRWLGIEGVHFPHGMSAIAAGLIFAGIVLLLDARFPSRGYLPSTLTKNRTVDRSDLILPGFVAFFVVGGIFLSVATGSATGSAYAFSRVFDGLVVLALLAGWVYFRRTYLALHWVLQRRPEAVVWVYVQQTRVMRNGYLVNTVWSAVTALESGELLTLTTSQAEAEMIVAEIAHVCPGVALGFTDQNRAQFNKDPKSLRQGPQAPTP